MHCVPSVYELTAAPDDIDFGTKTVGYAEVAAQTVTVTNTGNDWLLLAQPEAENYVISQIAEEDRYLAAGDSATFTIRPETGLPVGNYDTTITVTEDTSLPEPIALSLWLGDGDAEETPRHSPARPATKLKCRSPCEMPAAAPPQAATPSTMNPTAAPSTPMSATPKAPPWS